MIDASAVFCDALTVTVPFDEWEPLLAETSDVLQGASMELQHRDDAREIWATPGDTGIVRFQRMGRAGVVAIYASGASLALLRSRNMLGEYLHVLASRPHKVTRLDASADVACDAPRAISDLRSLGRSGAISLTRKSVEPEAVEVWERLRPDGQLSGSVYFAKKASVSLLVYDKRLERYDKTFVEWPDLSERVRYELRVTNGLPTLRDAYSPAPLFFQHLSPSVLQRPAGLPDRGHDGLGFTVERAAPALPAVRLKARVGASCDLGALCELARRKGAGGLPFLLSLVKARYEREEARVALEGVKGGIPLR